MIYFMWVGVFMCQFFRWVFRSVLRPQPFPMFTLPLGTVMGKHGISFHCYADDIQLYFPMKPDETIQLDRAALKP